MSISRRPIFATGTRTVPAALAAIRRLFRGQTRGAADRRFRSRSRTLLELERLDSRIALSATQRHPGPVPLRGLYSQTVVAPQLPRPVAPVSLAPAVRAAAASVSASVSVKPATVTVPMSSATVITLSGTGYSSSTFNGYVKLTSVATGKVQQLAKPTQTSAGSEDWAITLPAAWTPVGSSPTNTQFYVQIVPRPSLGTAYPATNSAANIVTLAPLPVPSIASLSASKGPITGGNVLQITGANLVDSTGKNLVTTVAFYASNGANVGGIGQSPDGTAISLLPGGTAKSATIQITVPDFKQSWNGKNGQPPLPVAPAGTAPLAVALILSNQQTPTKRTAANSYTVGYGPSVTGVAITGKPVANAPLAGGSVLTITGSGFDQKSSVQFSDPVSKKTFTVPTANVKYVGPTQLSVTVPNLQPTFATDVTVDVLVTSSTGFPSPLTAVDKVTFFRSQYTPLVIRVPQSLAQQGIYLASFALKQAADQKTAAQYGISMQVTPGTNGNNVGNFVDSSNWKTYDAANKVNLMKANPPLSFTTKPDAQGYVTATIQYDNYLYSKGMGTSGAAAVLSVGSFPRIVLSNDQFFAAGVPDPSANPGLTYGVLELAVSAIQASNYTAANSFLDITYVDQFGMPLQFWSAPNGPFPANALGATAYRQPTIQFYPSFVATAAASNPAAAAFGELLTAGQAAQILAPAKYLAQVEANPGIQPTPAPLASYPGGTLAPPADPTGVDTSQPGFAKGYFYFVTAVGATGQESAARPAAQQIPMPIADSNAMLLNWGAFPNDAIPTAAGYHVYRQAGWTAAEKSWTAYDDVAKLTSTPVTNLSFIDTGAQPANSNATLPTSNAAYSALSTYFDEALDSFFAHYATKTFSIYRDGFILTGNTVDGGETGAASFTYQSSSGAKTVKIYGRALLLTDTQNSQNQFVFLDPSSPYLAKNNWMGVQTNLGYSAGYQIFAAAGAAGDGGPADAATVGTNAANPWKDLQNSIATAFDRGLATNFALAPDAWATPPQFSAPAAVATGTPGTLQSVPYTYAVTGILQGGLETTLGVLTSAKPTQAGASVRLQWSTAPTGSPPGNAYQSFNVYRAKGYPGQPLSFKKVNNNPIPLPATGQIVTYVDRGRSATVQPTAQPVSYFAAGTTSDVYAAFMHRMGVNGRSYGYAYDDQGALASTSSIDYLQAAWLTVLPWGTGTAGYLAVDPLPANIRAVDSIDPANKVDLTHLTIGLQTMAGAGKYAYPVFGSAVGQSVRVTASNLPGVSVGTKALVSYTNGRANLSLSGGTPTAGQTYSLTLQLYNEVTGKPITAVKPVTMTFRTF
jgi:hypothetical protein